MQFTTINNVSQWLLRLSLWFSHKKSLKNIPNCCKLQIVFKNKARLCNNFHFKDQIPKYLTPGVVYKYQHGLYNESYDSTMSPVMVNVWDTWRLELVNMLVYHQNILVYHNLPKNKVSLRTVPQAITYYFAAIQHPMTILVF